MIGLQRVLVILAMAWAAPAVWALPAGGSDNEPKPLRSLPADGLFDRLDANQDGQLAPDEAPKEHRRLFDRLLRTSDHNADGLLNRTELRSGLTSATPDKPVAPPPSAELRGAKYARLLLLKLDADRDLVLTRDEAPSELHGSFDRLREFVDKNNDGMMSRFEINRAGPRLVGNGRQVARRMKWEVDDELARLEQEQGDAVYRFDNPIGPVEALGNPRRAKELFNQLDSNGDGKLTREEVPGPIRERLDRLFNRADANGDGALSRQEYMTSARRVARFLERTGLPIPDADKPKKAKGKPAAEQADSMADTPAKRQGKASESVAERLMRRMLKRADRDGDGQLTRAEATGPMARRFTEADANDDGVLDAEELAAATRRLDQKLRSTGQNLGQNRPPLGE